MFMIEIGRCVAKNDYSWLDSTLRPSVDYET